MLNGIFWVLFGLVIGWIAAILQGAKTPRQITGFIVLGGLGGVVGGLGGMALDVQSVGYQAGAANVMFAIFGACAFALIASVLTNKISGEE